MVQRLSMPTYLDRIAGEYPGSVHAINAGHRQGAAVYLLYLPKDRLICATKLSSNKSVPRRFRLRLALTRTFRWLVPAERCFTFPLAVTRNRFLIPL